MKKQYIEENSKWFKAALRISSQTLEPKEIGEILGLSATRIHEKGSLRSPRLTIVWKDAFWSFSSPLSSRIEMGEHLKFLLDLLESKTEALKQLSENCKIDLFCGFSSGSGQGGFELDIVTLSRLAKLNIPIELDLYPPGPIEAKAMIQTNQ